MGGGPCARTANACAQFQENGLRPEGVLSGVQRRQHLLGALLTLRAAAARHTPPSRAEASPLGTSGITRVGRLQMEHVWIENVRVIADGGLIDNGAVHVVNGRIEAVVSGLARRTAGAAVLDGEAGC